VTSSIGDDVHQNHEGVPTRTKFDDQPVVPLTEGFGESNTTPRVYIMFRRGNDDQFKLSVAGV